MKPSPTPNPERTTVNGFPIEILHVLRTGKPVCPKCGKGLESQGGSVVEAGSLDDGPLYWRCEDDGETWGFA